MFKLRKPKVSNNKTKVAKTTSNKKSKATTSVNNNKDNKSEKTMGNKDNSRTNQVNGDAYLDILMDLAQTSIDHKKVEKKESYIGRILGESPTLERGLKQRANTDDTEPCDLEIPSDSSSSGSPDAELASENCSSRQLQILSSWDDDDIMIYYAQSPSPSMHHGARRFSFSDLEEDEGDDPILPLRTRNILPDYGIDKAAARREFYLSRVPDSITEKTTFDSTGTCGSI